MLLFGGETKWDKLYTVLRFTLSTEDIEIVGGFPGWRGLYLGSAEFGYGNALYIGEHPRWDVTSYSISNKNGTSLNPTYVGSPPYDTYASCSAYDGNNTIYIIGGQTYYDRLGSIVKYNVQLYSTEIAGNLSSEIAYCSAIWYNNSAYIFGSWPNDPTRVAHLTESSGGTEVEILPVQIPIYFRGGTAITDGKFIYLVGGFEEGTELTIAKFDPVAERFTSQRETLEV